MRRDDSGHMVLVLRAKTHAGSGKAAEPQTNECDLVESRRLSAREGGKGASYFRPPNL